jgi:hypothetical protein
VKLTVRRTNTGQVDLCTARGEVIRHTTEDEYGSAELVLKFDDPIGLQLAEKV